MRSELHLKLSSMCRSRLCLNLCSGLCSVSRSKSYSELYCPRGCLLICEVVQFGLAERFSPRQCHKQSAQKAQYEYIMIKRLQSRNGDRFDVSDVQEMSNFCSQLGLSSDGNEHPLSIFRLIHHSR
jgi:hypothetical protein